MKINQHLSKFHTTLAVTTLACVCIANAGAGEYKERRVRPIANIVIGSDLNSAENDFIQPQDPALAGGGRDQTMQFGDILRGSRRDDLLIGRLGTDILAGGRGDDVMIGGLEHFNPLNRDRAFGGSGNDIFIWKPGDGSDLFEGGRRRDVVIFGNIGELVDGAVDFGVINDQKAGEVALNPNTGLPQVNVTGSPGFCDVIDRSSSYEAKQALKDLQLDHLVQFSLRGVRDSFDAGQQSEDNGLRVTLHLKDVETLVCTNRFGDGIEVLDLRTTPPTEISIDDVRPAKLRNRLKAIVF